MADEEQNENVEETTPAAEAEAPAAAEPTEAVADEAPAAEASDAGEDAAPAAAPASPKEQRRKARAAKVAAAAGSRPQRSPEERQAERDVARKAKAGRRRAARLRTRERAKATHTGEATPPREHGEGRQKVRQGIVVSDKADKTITVRIDTARQHRRYHKIVRSSTTLHAHDERNDAHVGDTVIVRESRPLSRLKRWRLVEVVERAR
jgi:small subunit ribosomal protein S17